MRALIRMLEEGLARSGYDGLYADDCGCKIGDLMPCGSFANLDWCEPGVLSKGPCNNCSGGNACDFHIGPRPEQPPPAPETDLALRLIRDATGLALADYTIAEAVAVIISQRNNARRAADTFRARLKEETGKEYVG